MENAYERPRFRIDLVAQPFEEGGICFVDVTDPESGSTFRFYDVEYTIACAMDGERDLAGLAEWSLAELGIETSTEELQGVVDTLAELGYLEAAAAVAGEEGEADVAGAGPASEVAYDAGEVEEPTRTFSRAEIEAEEPTRTFEAPRADVEEPTRTFERPPAVAPSIDGDLEAARAAEAALEAEAAGPDAPLEDEPGDPGLAAATAEAPEEAPVDEGPPPAGSELSFGGLLAGEEAAAHDAVARRSAPLAPGAGAPGLAAPRVRPAAAAEFSDDDPTKLPSPVPMVGEEEEEDYVVDLGAHVSLGKEAVQEAVRASQSIQVPELPPDLAAEAEAAGLGGEAAPALPVSVAAPTPGDAAAAGAEATGAPQDAEAADASAEPAPPEGTEPPADAEAEDVEDRTEPVERVELEPPAAPGAAHVADAAAGPARAPVAAIPLPSAPPPSRAAGPAPAAKPAVAPPEPARGRSSSTGILLVLLLLVAAAAAAYLYVTRWSKRGGDEGARRPGQVSATVPPGTNPAPPTTNPAPPTTNPAPPTTNPTNPTPPPLAAAKLVERTPPAVDATVAADGAIAWLAPEGTVVKAGDPVAKLLGHKKLEGDLAATVDRLKTYEERLARAREANNAAAIKLAEGKVADKKELIDRLTREVEALLIRAPADGTVHVLVAMGARVAAGGAVVRVGGGAPELAAEFVGVAAADKYEFACQVAAKAAVDRLYSCVIDEVEGDKVQLHLVPGTDAKVGDEVVLLPPK